MTVPCPRPPAARGRVSRIVAWCCALLLLSGAIGIVALSLFEITRRLVELGQQRASFEGRWEFEGHWE